MSDVSKSVGVCTHRIDPKVTDPASTLFYWMHVTIGIHPEGQGFFQKGHPDLLASANRMINSRLYQQPTRCSFSPILSIEACDISDALLGILGTGNPESRNFPEGWRCYSYVVSPLVHNKGERPLGFPTSKVVVPLTPGGMPPETERRTFDLRVVTQTSKLFKSLKKEISRPMTDLIVASTLTSFDKTTDQGAARSLS